MDPIYIVAGHQRSFTNAMMECLYYGSDGKLRPLHTPERHDRYRNTIDDDSYQFNDGRLFELEYCCACRHEQWLQDNRGTSELVSCDDPKCMSAFLRDPSEAAGRLVKMHIVKAGWSLPDANYKLIVLMRDYEEIRQSWAGMGLTMELRPEQYYSAVAGFTHAAPMKPPDKLLLWAQDAFGPSSLQNLKTWERIRNAGWPIDLMRAVERVRHDLNRFQRGLITDGMPCVAETKDPTIGLKEMVGLI